MKPAQPKTPKVVQPKKSVPTRVAAAALTAPRVVQARTEQFKNGSTKPAARPVYRPATKKIVQPKSALPGHPLRGSLITTARTIQRAEENPYKKLHMSYVPTKSSKRATARASPYGGKGAMSPRLQAQSGGAVRPNYTPAKDSLGNLIWDGSRNCLSWSAVITAAMAMTKGGGCQLQGNLCTGVADGIDHGTDFATLQSEITKYVICDGKHHFKACYKEDAVHTYNCGDDPSKMRWSCTQCNSQKGGVKGVYENQPVWIRQCPGACGYALRGEEAE